MAVNPDEETRPILWEAIGRPKPSKIKQAFFALCYFILVCAALVCLVTALVSCSAVRVPENIEATRDAVEAIRIDVRGLSDQTVTDPIIKADMAQARNAEADRKQERRQSDQDAQDWLLSLLGSLGLGGGLTASLVALGLKYWQAHQTQKKLDVAYDCADLAKEKAITLGANKTEIKNEMIMAAASAGVQSSVAKDIQKRKKK